MTDAAIAAVTARPTLFPNWATSLKTPPASDWTSGGKESDMTRLDAVKSTVLLLAGPVYRITDRTGLMYIPSGFIGDKKRAQNGANQ